MNTHSIRFTVLGVAEPKGSSRAFMPKGWARPVITSTNRNLKGWEQTIRATLQEVLARTPAETRAVLFDGPVSVTFIFALPRPKSLPKRVTEHVKKPDLDKLIRAAGDAMNGVVYHDDSQVVAIGARKRYAEGAASLEILVESWADARPLLLQKAQVSA